MSPYKIIIVKTLGKSSNIRIGMDQPCSIIFVNTTNGKVGHERYIGKRQNTQILKIHLSLEKNRNCGELLVAAMRSKMFSQKYKPFWTVMYLLLYKEKQVRERSWLQKLSTIEGQEARSPYAL